MMIHLRTALLGLYLTFMTNDETALAGFRRSVPRGYEHISAIPILLRGTRRLTDTLSSSDIRLINRFNLDLLLLPVDDNLQRIAVINAEEHHSRLPWIFPITCKQRRRYKGPSNKCYKRMFIVSRFAMIGVICKALYHLWIVFAVSHLSTLSPL